MHAGCNVQENMAEIAFGSWLVFTICVLGAFGDQLTDEPIAFKNATWEKCKKQEKVPDGAMNDLYLFKSAEGVKDYKCVAKCIHEEYGMLQKDGKIDIKVIEKAIKGLWNDPKVQEKLMNIASGCVNQEGQSSDPCQYSYDLIACFLDGMKKVEIGVA